MLGLVDHVIMTAEAYAFVSGPMMVEQFTGVPMSKEELGGPSVHDRTSGVASFVVGRRGRSRRARRRTARLPPRPHRRPSADLARPAPTRSTGRPRRPTRCCRRPRTAPTTSATSSPAVVDDGYLLEPHANWAANLVTAFATIGGRPVGIVANQPQTVAGTLDIPASQKGGRFVACATRSTCRS